MTMVNSGLKGLIYHTVIFIKFVNAATIFQIIYHRTLYNQYKCRSLNVLYVVASTMWASLPLNPLSLHDSLMHHFTSLKIDLIFLQPRVLERKFP